MFRFTVCALLLAAILAPGGRAQSQYTMSGTKPRLAFTVQEAPEALVYKIFFDELVGSQRAADDLRSKGGDDTKMRTLFQRAFALEAHEHQSLIRAAQTCVTTMESNQRTAQELTPQLKLVQDKSTLYARLNELQANSDASVSLGIQQLRAALGPGRFARLDQSVRQHVVPRLKRVRALPRDAKPLGGK
jgi:hypothetical protein